MWPERGSVPPDNILLSKARYLLLAAAFSMGGVAIWSMHYIGNRAIVINHGEGMLQIEYSPGGTAGSFFLPICVVVVAFYLVSRVEKVGALRILLAGMLVGAAVCGMHYSGQSGISNYHVTYIWPYVFGSALIAITAGTVALGVFFYFKATWTNSWKKRMLCASLLAVSVSGMHWVATVGTVYRFKMRARNENGLSRQAVVVVVLCLVCSIVLALQIDLLLTL